MKRWLQFALVGLGLGSCPIWPQELFQEKSDIAPVEVERIYVKGLQYLVRSQNPDGTWNDTSYGKEPAVIGLAVVSMLAHGDDPNWSLQSAHSAGLGFHPQTHGQERIHRHLDV